MDNKLFWRVDLQLFAEDGDGAGTDTGASSGVAEAVAAAQQKQALKNPLSGVVYGKQEVVPPAEGQKQDGQPEAVDRSAEFDRMIRGDYRDEYSKRVSATVQNRVKGMRETVDRYDKIRPALELLSKRYGINADDADAFVKAVNDDEELLDAEALEMGTTREAAREIRQLRQSNRAMTEKLEAQKSQEQRAQVWGQWHQESEALKSVIPTFDFDAEMENPRFAELLAHGVDVRGAYIVTHYEQMLPDAMNFAAQQAEQRVRNSVIANGQRPVENGSSQAAAAVVKSDVSKLSRADRAEIARRVARGEQIRF